MNGKHLTKGNNWRVTELKQQLITALLKEGQAKLAQVWCCSPQEASRRINGDRGILIDDLAKAFEALDIKLVTDDESLVIPRDEVKALNLFANRYLERRVKGGGHVPAVDEDEETD